MVLPESALLEVNASAEEDKSQDVRVHRALAWDYDAGDFLLKDGKVVELEGTEYLKAWIKKTLMTIRNSKIFTETGYGSEHFSLIGSSYRPTFVNEEMKRMIREALLTNDAINDVTNFIFTHSGSALVIEFRALTIYGTIESEVRA